MLSLVTRVSWLKFWSFSFFAQNSPMAFSLLKKPKSIKWSTNPYVIEPPVTSLILAPIILFIGHSMPATLGCLLFLEHRRWAFISGLCTCSLGLAFCRPRYLPNSFPHFFQVFSQMPSFLAILYTFQSWIFSIPFPCFILCNNCNHYYYFPLKCKICESRVFFGGGAAGGLFI